MKLFHHCGKQFSTNLLIIQIQWLNSITPIIPYIEKYKSYNINDYIPPLRQDYSRKLQIIKIQWLHSSTAANHSPEKYKLYKFITPFHLCGNPFIEKYKSYNINDYIPPLR